MTKLGQSESTLDLLEQVFLPELWEKRPVTPGFAEMVTLGLVGEMLVEGV